MTLGRSAWYQLHTYQHRKWDIRQNKRRTEPSPVNTKTFIHCLQENKPIANTFFTINICWTHWEHERIKKKIHSIYRLFNNFIRTNTNFIRIVFSLTVWKLRLCHYMISVIGTWRFVTIVSLSLMIAVCSSNQKISSLNTVRLFRIDYSIKDEGALKHNLQFRSEALLIHRMLG